MKRIIVSIFLVITMMLGSFSTSFAAAEADIKATDEHTAVFKDITNHWASDAIGRWAGYGIINGYKGFFRPNDPITRGEMAVIFDNMMNYQTTAANSFSDLPEGNFYANAVLKANAVGLMKGDGIAVRPEDKITREEAVVMMGRAFAVDEASESNIFLDASSVSTWAEGAVSGFIVKGYIFGYDRYFNPKANITRAEAIAIIDRIVKAYYTTPGIYTDNVSGTTIVKVAGVTLKNSVVSGNLILAEGIGKGSTVLDSVTVKGNTVIRGGGETGVQITGASGLDRATVQTISDKLGIKISQTTVKNMDIVSGEDIIVSGNMGTILLEASNSVVYAVDAAADSATISGKDSQIIWGTGSSVKTITVAGTAQNTTIQAETGALVETVIAFAKTNLIGPGTIERATFNEGSNGSSASAPNTYIIVTSGVADVTGAGDIPIPEGCFGLNNTTGTDCQVSTTQPTSSASYNHSSSGSVPTPTLTLEKLTVTGTEIIMSGGIYRIPAGTNTSSTSLDVTIENLTSVLYSCEMTITKTNTGEIVADADVVGVEKKYLSTLSTADDVPLNTMLDAFSILGSENSGWYKASDQSTASGSVKTAFADAIEIMYNTRMHLGTLYTVTVNLTPTGGYAGSVTFYMIKSE